MLTTGKIYAKGNKRHVRTGIKLCKKYLSDLTSDDVILDIGCGTGEITQFLATSGGKVTGIDKNFDIVQYAKEHNRGENISYEIIDAQDPNWFVNPKLQGKFTAVTSFQVLHWIPNLEAVLRNIYRVVAPGGRCLIQHVIHPSSGCIGVLPNLTLKPKWKAILDKENFKWEAPLFRVMYEEGSFRWMDDIQALKEIIVSAGFSIKFMDMNTEIYEPTEARCRPVLPVLSCMNEAQQTEFLKQFIDASVKEECYKVHFITYILNK